MDYPWSIPPESTALLTHVSVTDTSLDCNSWSSSVSVTLIAPSLCLIPAQEALSALCPLVVLFKVELPVHSLPEIPAEFNRCRFCSWCRILGICGSAHPPGAQGCACPGTHRPAPLSWLGPPASFQACWPLKAKYKTNKFEKSKERVRRERGNQPGCAPASSRAVFSPSGVCNYLALPCALLSLLCAGRKLLSPCSF